MGAWTFIWLMFILKIPVVGLLLLVRWAVRAVPEPEVEVENEGHDDGGAPAGGPRPRHPRPGLSRLPRRGPRGPHHGAPAPSAPPRVRSVLRRARPVHH